MSKKLLKISIGIISSLAIILLICLILTLSLVNPNQYKSKLTNLVSAKINREVTIDGNLEWSLFPLGITINELKVANLSNFTDKYLLTSEQATVNLKVLPLIFQDYQLNNLYLKNTQIYLEKNVDNKTNYQFNNDSLSSQDTSSITTENPPVQDSSSKLDNNLPNISISRIVVENGSLTWREPGEKLKIEHIEFNSRNFSLNNDTPIKIYTSFKARSRFFQADLFNELDMKITLQNNLKKINLNIASFNISLGGKSFPRHPYFKLSTKITADLENKKFVFNNFNSDINHLMITGDLSGELNYDNPGLDGNLKIAKSSLEDFFHTLNFENENSYEHISGNVEFSTNNKLINISPLELNLDNDKITGKVTIEAVF